MNIWMDLLVAAGAIAIGFINNHYWFVLTRAQRKLTDDDRIDQQFW
jgi:HAMP domain-containing protein